MKITKILTLIAFLGVLNTFGQRTIIWVHGAGANNSFWETQANNFTDRQENRQTYGQIRVAGFSNDIRNRSTANDRNIAIGHNMGGVALRELNHTNPNHFGGVITFGAPLDGAPIISAVERGDVNRVIASVDEILERGPNADTPGIFDFVFSLFSKRGWERYGANVYGTIILNVLGGGNVDFAGALNFDNAVFLQDLKVGGNYMETAKNYESNIPKIIVYGDEESPIHVRLASSGESGGKNDTELLEGYATARDVYRVQAEAWQPAGFCLANCKKKRAISRAWRDGYEYLALGFEEDWNYLIGAYRIETRTYTEWVNICDGVDGDMYRTSMNLILPIRSECYEQRTYTTSTRIKEPSDGILPRSTAEGLLSRWTKQNTQIVRAPGVNNLEMGEHQESRRILDEAFNGSEYNPFFRNVN